MFNRNNVNRGRRNILDERRTRLVSLSLCLSADSDGRQGTSRQTLLRSRVAMNQGARRNVRENITNVEDRIEIGQVDRCPVDALKLRRERERRGEETRAREREESTHCHIFGIGWIENQRIADGEVRLDHRGEK